MTKVAFVGGLVVAMLAPGAAAGQQGGGDLDLVAGQLQPGTGVYVRMTNGRRIKADISRLQSDSMVLTNGMTLAEQDILSIELQDPLWTGAAIGLGVGVALLASRPVGSDSGAALVSGIAFLLAVPAGIGAMVDGSFHRTVYTRMRTVQFSPARGGLGARLSVSW